MGQDKNDPQITIDGQDYKVSEFTDKQKVLLDHVVDLERKVANARFNLDQLQIGRDAFLNMLRDELKQDESVAVN